jgi:hypothetical protein
MYQDELRIVGAKTESSLVPHNPLLLANVLILVDAPKTYADNAKCVSTISRPYHHGKFMIEKNNIKKTGSLKNPFFFTDLI